MTTTELGFGTSLNPSSIRVSRHAVTQYCKRRGWGTYPEARSFAEHAIRELLRRVAHQTPPVCVLRGHTPSRRYEVGDLAFVVSADHSTLITVYQLPKKRSGTKR